MGEQDNAGADARYHVDPKRVVHEEVEGEVVIIDLALGCYFSLSGAGVEVWRAVASGSVTSADAAAAIAASYEVGDEDAADAATRLLGELLEAGLVVTAAEDGAAAQAPSGQPGTRAPYAPPALERFTDMQDFLLLDPIHEVDARGWPAPPPQR